MPLVEPKHILITGTTSGIGRAMLEAYRGIGWRVTAINRRVDADLERAFPEVTFRHLDVRDEEAVKQYCAETAERQALPAVYFLSAGINKVDNVGVLDSNVFRDVIDTNLMGVLNFVAAVMPHVGKERVVFVAASSTTNIFSNPNCMGYFVSKLALHEMFRKMDTMYRSRGIRFKSIVLGPVATNIFAGATMASRLQMRVRQSITVSAADVAGPVMRFVDSRRQVLYYPRRAVFLFLGLRLAIRLYPGLYRGSVPGEAA